MRNKFRNYFIGKYLDGSYDVFEMARAKMLYQFSIVFTIVFFLPLLSDISFGLKKATILHTIDFITLFTFPFLIKKLKKLDASINIFFGIALVSNMCIFMILNPEKFDAIALAWSAFFIFLGALLLKGFSRILFCCILFWIPIAYVIINIQLKGALTIDFLKEKNVPDAPPVFISIPLMLGAMAAWSHTRTNEQAKQTIMQQKALIEMRNKEVTDSIHYAKRIQDSLLPTEKFIQKNMERMRKK